MTSSPATSVRESGMAMLSQLLLASTEDEACSAVPKDMPGWAMLRELADANHVIVRGFERLSPFLQQRGDKVFQPWVDAALTQERERIARAVPFLHRICASLTSSGHDATVIKSLDHWPDLGSDLDLYTSADPQAVVDQMGTAFGARVAPRSWGDRLAGKWNFSVPGLPELVEIHMGRLGQTGEHVSLAASIPGRARTIKAGGLAFQTTSITERLLISTLQRMYRHFYFRLCDIVDTVTLAEGDGIDYADLQSAASSAGIWEGTATFLVIVSDYLLKYRGSGLNLPGPVRSAARFGGESVYYARGFLRLPILPQSAGLYRSQLGKLLWRGQLSSGARLSLLPCLAAAAVVGQRITGSDKGIW